MLATHTQITAGSTRSPPLIGHVTARYDEKYYNRCYRNLLPVSFGLFTAPFLKIHRAFLAASFRPVRRHVSPGAKRRRATSRRVVWLAVPCGDAQKSFAEATLLEDNIL